MSSVRRNSMGRTILPSSSTFRMIPVDFMESTPSFLETARQIYQYDYIDIIDPDPAVVKYFLSAEVKFVEIFPEFF
jgi:hypothetical protein